MSEVTVADLKRRHDGGEQLVLLDVREPDELATASIPWALAIPMGEIPSRYAELPHDQPVVCMCHHGTRSEHVMHFLHANGYGNAVNLAGGIDAWAATIDRSVPRY